MSGILPGDAPHHRMVEHSPSRFSYSKSDEHICVGSSWYFNRKEIEENSPSRKDGIDLKKESYFRKSYCTFLQDLGMRLKVPQVMIATAIVFCHRFFLRQSHAKNDRRTIATVCMFLAGKVEETPRPLKDVILVSYEIIHKKDPAAVQRIKQKEVYEQQKELVLLGERLVLATLGFDLNVHHPYKPLVEAIKKFKVAQNALAQVAWNFVNDGLRTSLCLQFKPHHIAAGAIFLAAKFLKVKLPSDGEKVWWQEFDVTPRQLEEVSNQMLELYEQNRATPSSHGNEAEGGTASMTNHQAPAKALPAIEQSPTQYSQAAGTTNVQHGIPTNPLTSQLQAGPGKAAQIGSNDHGETEPRSVPCDHKTEGKFKDRLHSELGNIGETSDSRFSYGSEHPAKEPIVPHMVGNGGTKDMNPVQSEVPKSHTPMDAMKKIDKDKVKAALEKRRKSRSDATKKIDLIDEDDLIERELEHGVELAVEDERERRHSWSRPFNRQEPQNLDHGTKNGIQGTEKDTENAEEGEVNAREFRSPDPGSRKRKAASPSKQVGLKEYCDFPHINGPSLKH